jgi:ubiquinone/menaquinone biosynthesis C-methylase UbiE
MIRCVAELQYDRTASARLVSAYTTSDVQSHRDEVRRSLAAQPNERVLDLGSGPGILACELAKEVAPEGTITAVDISAEMNAIASSRIREAGLADRIDVREGDAVALALPEGSFDAAVSTQVIEYVEDVDAALREVGRVLRPGGRLVLLDTDWATLVWSSRDGDRATQILEAWSTHAPQAHLPRTLAPRLRECGFVLEEVRALTLLNTSYTEATFSYNIAPLIADFVRKRQVVAEREVEAWLAELAELDQDGAYFFSLNRFLFRAVKRAAEA